MKFMTRKLEENEEEGEEGLRLAIQTLILVLMLIVYITVGPLLRRKKINFVRASGFTMLVGLVLTLLVLVVFNDTKFCSGFQFNSVFFFTFILPWIIYSGGYTTMIESFIKYFKLIALFSLSGTLITFIIISAFTYFLTNKNSFTFTQTDEKGLDNKTIQFTLVEILQFSAAISATDSISSFSVFMESDDPKLDAIGFGDSIINNAICLALFKIVSRLNEREDKKLTAGVVWEIIYKCVLVFVFSILIGGGIGLLFSLFLKKMKFFKLNRVQEIGLMLLFAFISYTLCDLINLSAMISLLSCGLFMSHYAFYNLSFQTREESTLISLVLSTLAEALVFSSLGMTLVYYTTQALSISFIIWEIILIIVCRIITIFGQIFILEKCGCPPFYLSFSHQGILSITGMMRGAVSFAIVMTMQTDNQIYKEVCITSVIYIVFLTNIILTAVLPMFSRKLKAIDNQQAIQPETITADDRDKNEDIFTFLHPNTELIKDKLKRKKSLGSIDYNQSLVKKVMDYDEMYILPKIVKDWPNVKIDNNNISNLVKNELKKWAESRPANAEEDEDNFYAAPIPKTEEEVAKAHQNAINNRLEMKEFKSSENNNDNNYMETLSDKIKSFDK